MEMENEERKWSEADATCDDTLNDTQILRRLRLYAWLCKDFLSLKVCVN